MAKKAKKATKKKATMEMVVVGSKVKAYVKDNGLMSSGDLLEGLNVQVHALLDAAMKRTQANKRSTVRGTDL